MTISSDSTAELTINELVQQALTSVGMMALEQVASGSQWNARAAAGRRELQLILGELQARKCYLRQVENYTITIAEGDGAEASPIELPETTLDVVGDGMWKAPSQTVESPVKQISRDQWHHYGDKVSDGLPWAMYVDKSAPTVKIFLLQPAAAAQAGATLRIQRHRLLANMVQAGGNTPDLERPWHSYLKWRLAAYFAGGSLPAQAALAMKHANDALQLATASSTNQAGQQFSRGRW